MMNRTVKIASLMILVTALIGVGLWAFGYPPPSDDPIKQASTVRAVVTSPFFWAGSGGIITALIVAMKKRNFSGAKSDALPATGILMIPALALMMQILAPLVAYDMISDVGVQGFVLGALALFLLIVGNFIVTVAPGSRIGIRNRWTLSDPNVWIKTHRFFGPRLMLTVLVVTPAAFFINAGKAHYILLAAVILLKGVTWLYARGLARKSAFHARPGVTS